MGVLYALSGLCAVGALVWWALKSQAQQSGASGEAAGDLQPGAAETWSAHEPLSPEQLLMPIGAGDPDTAARSDDQP